MLLARLEAQDQLESVLEHLSDEMHKSLQVTAGTDQNDSRYVSRVPSRPRKAHMDRSL